VKAWKEEVSSVDIQNVISYIYTLQGTNPANQKAPDGVIVEEELAPSSDSTGVKDSVKVIEVK